MGIDPESAASPRPSPQHSAEQAEKKQDPENDTSKPCRWGYGFRQKGGTRRGNRYHCKNGHPSKHFRLHLDILRTSVCTSSYEIQSRRLSFHGWYSESLPKDRRDWQKWHLVLPVRLRAEIPEGNRIRPLFGNDEDRLCFL